MCHLEERPIKAMVALTSCKEKKLNLQRRGPACRCILPLEEGQGEGSVVPSCLRPPPGSRAAPCFWVAGRRLGPRAGQPGEAAPVRDEDKGTRARWTPLGQGMMGSPATPPPFRSRCQEFAHSRWGCRRAGLPRPPLRSPTLAFLRGVSPRLPRQGGHLRVPLQWGTRRSAHTLLGSPPPVLFVVWARAPPPL
ncbi:uncharacterized protein LOC104869909 isoform X2 [Fukomys damarensis]|uniref:uncharacterized protein LOC104869909 isoform X2 n=1 Tax=Fukomys damarensis TaxID=885580 RepID=UPI001455A3E3|nr:uncharacterized protein LOC104869909 isoform X2 [Fukomys damarensis]